MAAHSEKVMFAGSHGFPLAARLDFPAGSPKATALFAHCFTCSKDVFAASRIAGELAGRGFAVLRFDFTGLGMSGGEFANTNFSSNVQDIVAAADYLRGRGMPVSVLIGHSLGGAAVLAAAGLIEDAKAVATIGAPADAAHVVHNFSAHLENIRETGEAAVTLAGRQFTIKKQFLDDLETTHLAESIRTMSKALIVFHSPADATVGLDNASAIFGAAKHPKSFISLPDADHLLSRKEDAVYVAEVLTAWASRYIGGAGAVQPNASDAGTAVIVSETGAMHLQQEVRVGSHVLIADEPQSVGGNGTGPTPYDFLAAALGACTSITMRLYADFKKLPVGKISVKVTHEKTHLADCKECAAGTERRIDAFNREIEIEGDLDSEIREKLLGIANKCPVHNTLERGAHISTRMRGGS